jgi:hypothetical protein
MSILPQEDGGTRTSRASTEVPAPCDRAEGEGVMRVIDPGHVYALAHLDGSGVTILDFVKREGVKYPGNVGAHEGVNLQECWRAEIDRLKYLDEQEPCQENLDNINDLRKCILRLERRAARRHGRSTMFLFDGYIEDQPTCPKCGHIGCQGRCRE